MLFVSLANKIDYLDQEENIVKELKELGRSDAWIQKHLGMDADEVIRLKQLTGLADLFKDQEFSNSWDVEGSQE